MKSYIKKLSMMPQNGSHQAFFEEKISETTGELKKLRPPRKSLGISNKTNF